MKPRLSLQTHLQHRPILAPCREPEEAACGAGQQSPLLVLSTCLLQFLAPAFPFGSSAEAAQQLSTECCLCLTLPSEPSPICRKPSEQHRGGAGLFSTHGLQPSRVRLAVSRSHTASESQTVCRLCFVLRKLHRRSTILGLDCFSLGKVTLISYTGQHKSTKRFARLTNTEFQPHL